MNPTLNIAVRAARSAGNVIIRNLGKLDTLAIHTKDRNDFVTEVDRQAEQEIIYTLRKAFPGHGILAEESGQHKGNEDFQWIIDPLDGTKEFVNRNDEFTVNIALIDNHRPILGVVHVPVMNKTYTGVEGVGSAVRSGDSAPRPIAVAAASAKPVRVVGSRSHRGASLDAFLERLGDFDMHPMGSSLKFCVIAEGGADIYPRLGLTSEWDTAAAQAVVEQAGGAVLELDGQPLAYNAKADILNPHFLVRGPADQDWLGIIAAGE